MAGIIPDPKKRSFLLPPGCKDLYDLLQPRRSHKKQVHQQPLLTAASLGLTTNYDDPVKGRISELERYVAKMTASQAWMRTLLVYSLEHDFNVSISQGGDLPISVSLALEIGSERDKKMQEYCIRYSLALPDDDGIPAMFRPDLPVSQIYRLALLPYEVVQLTKLLELLFQEVAALNGDAEVYFHYEETTKSA